MLREGIEVLDEIELREVGDVAGKSMLHLQCHIGTDTLAWARRGAVVTGLDFSGESIACAERLRGELGIDARFVHANVYDAREAIDEAFDIVYTSKGVLTWLRDIEEWGHIEILINNAGGLVGEAPQSYASFVSEKDLRATLDRNLMSTIFCCQAVADSMKNQNWGRIVNTTSQAALQTMEQGVFSSYAAAKAGVVAYTRYLAQELGPYGITVNCISPAYVSTARVEKVLFSLPGKREQFLSQIALGRMAIPDDISKAVEFFVTDLGDYVTGQCLSVCGGVIRF